MICIDLNVAEATELLVKCIDEVRAVLLSLTKTKIRTGIIDFR